MLDYNFVIGWNLRVIDVFWKMELGEEFIVMILFFLFGCFWDGMWLLVFEFIKMYL